MEVQSHQQTLIDRAIACHKSGRYDDAEALYLGAVCAAGDHSAVALQLGMLYIQNGKPVKAVETLEDFLRTAPDSADAWVFLGQARLRLAQPGLAAYAHLRALAIRPNDVSIDEMLATTIKNGGGLETVLSDSTLIGMEPSFAELYAVIVGHGPDVTHSIFSQYRPWNGVPPEGFQATPYGSLMRKSFYGPALRAATYHQPGLPPPRDEEYFEWIDLLESIVAAKKSFTMVELGAGYGRWLISAVAAIRMHRNIPFHLIGVEAEEAHFDMMRQHFIDNGVNPDDHRLIKAAVSEKDGEVYFMNGHSEDWWGQSIAANRAQTFADLPEVKIRPVPSLSIATILDGIDLVDLVDMDVQGAESDAVCGSMDTLCAKVKRVHIGTHGRGIERDLGKMFSEARWICCNNFPSGQTVQTHYGPISFVDGVQTWINPALLDR